MKSIFFVSDRTGITTEMLGNALLTQFAGIKFYRESAPFVDSELKADHLLLKIHNHYLQDGQRPIVFTSIVNPEIRNKFKQQFVLHIDFFEAFIPQLENEFAIKASLVIGQFHGIGNEKKYYKRIDAIQFALDNDDGISLKNYAIADVILLGVSRVGKTPTCLYLAINYGIKAANYPLTDQDLISDQLPKILLPYANKLFGLTTAPHRLHNIRAERLPNSHYATLKNCIYEIERSENIMRNAGILFLNTHHKSIEEMAVAIMQQIKLERIF